jgi:hypothetical protein
VAVSSVVVSVVEVGTVVVDLRVGVDVVGVEGLEVVINVGVVVAASFLK